MPAKRVSLLIMMERSRSSATDSGNGGTVDSFEYNNGTDNGSNDVTGGGNDSYSLCCRWF